MKVAIYPGTFDPITNGHVDIMQRAANLFDAVIVAVGTNTRKNTLFSLEKRIFFCKDGVRDIKNIRVMPLDELTVDFAKQHQAGYLVRGIRHTDDVNDELSIANMNYVLSHQTIETVFFAARDEFRSLSSSIVREIMMMKGDISAFVPQCVSEAIWP